MTLAPTRNVPPLLPAFLLREKSPGRKILPLPPASCILIRPRSALQPEKQRGETTLGTAVNHGPTAAQIRTAFSSDRLIPGKSIDRSPKTRESNPQMQLCSRQLHTIVARLPLDSAGYLARVSLFSNYSCDIKKKKRRPDRLAFSHYRQNRCDRIESCLSGGGGGEKVSWSRITKTLRFTPK